MPTDLSRPATTAPAVRDGLDGINVDLADNGYTVRCSYRQNTKGGGVDYSSKTHVFEGKKELLAFLKSEIPEPDGTSAEDDGDNDEG